MTAACSHCGEVVEATGETVCTRCFAAHSLSRPCARCAELFQTELSALREAVRLVADAEAGMAVRA